MLLTVMTGSVWARGDQVVPPSVVTHTPPLAPAAYKCWAFFASPATALTRPWLGSYIVLCSGSVRFKGPSSCQLAVATDGASGAAVLRCAASRSPPNRASIKSGGGGPSISFSKRAVLGLTSLGEIFRKKIAIVATATEKEITRRRDIRRV